jgi:hypothetical protein
MLCVPCQHEVKVEKNPFMSSLNIPPEAEARICKRLRSPGLISVNRFQGIGLVNRFQRIDSAKLGINSRAPKKI